jgi:hypothetical protein
MAVRLGLIVQLLWDGQLCGVLSVRKGNLNGCWDVVEGYMCCRPVPGKTPRLLPSYPLSQGFTCLVEIGHCICLEASVGALRLGLDRIVGEMRLLLVLV